MAQPATEGEMLFYVQVPFVWLLWMLFCAFAWLFQVSLHAFVWFLWVLFCAFSWFLWVLFCAFVWFFWVLFCAFFWLLWALFCAFINPASSSPHNYPLKNGRRGGREELIFITSSEKSVLEKYHTEMSKQPSPLYCTYCL